MALWASTAALPAGTSSATMSATIQNRPCLCSSPAISAHSLQRHCTHPAGCIVWAIMENFRLLLGPTYTCCFTELCHDSL